MLTVAQLAPLKDRDPYLYETLVKIVSSVDATLQTPQPSADAPAPKPYAMPSEDLKPLYDFTLDCKTCQARLASAT